MYSPLLKERMTLVSLAGDSNQVCLGRKKGGSVISFRDLKKPVIFKVILLCKRVAHLAY
jgi:hypothetical protein